MEQCSILLRFPPMNPKLHDFSYGARWARGRPPLFHNFMERGGRVADLPCSITFLVPLGPLMPAFW